MSSLKIVLLYALLCTPFSILANKTTILIKIPTRSRPDQFFKTLDTYYQNLSSALPYTFLISCDKDDATMNKKKIIQKMESYPNLVYSFTDNTSKIEACNKDINNFVFNILILASDDTRPVVKNFDLLLFRAMQEAFPDTDGMLNINDGTIGRSCATIPVIGYKYYKRFNYVYHPSYKALVCDVELTNVSKMLKKEKVIDQVLIKHYHPAWKLAPDDALYQKNETYHSQDKVIFENRQANYFDLSPQQLEQVTPKLWSILICTIEGREQSFQNIYQKLTKQIQDSHLENHVEILYYKDKRGEHSIGHKRNVLLEQSKGKYISYVDDDDDVHNQYVELIASKLLNNPDCVNLNGIITFDGGGAKKFVHSIKYDRYFEQGGTYFRPPNHLNPIRRAIAAQFTFPEVNLGEDTDWAMQIARSKLLRTEETINEPYYFYHYVRRK